MTILILGGGGREHALAWKIKQSPRVDKIYISPGNAGTEDLGENIDLQTHSDIINFSKINKIDLVVVGPDKLLAEGIVDKLSSAGLKVFGPAKRAAEIEWSKAFAKKLMSDAGIPTAEFKAFTNFELAEEYLKSLNRYPVVLKASGLALGKGVIVADNFEDASHALTSLMIDKAYGDAGKEVVIEEYLNGKEISIHAFCDGEEAILFPAAQDHKRIFDNDEGPNTGGMGTITPVPWVTKSQLVEIKERIVVPVLKQLLKMDRKFSGVLYPGIMMTDIGPKVLEFNARFGDPETQSYMRILKSDLVDIMMSCIEGKLSETKVEWEDKSSCCVVIVSKGYPDESEKGQKISGLETATKGKDVVVFHAATKKDNNGVATNGGRVLGVSAAGNNLKEALSKAYRAMQFIKFPGMQYRQDIGNKSIS